MSILQQLLRFGSIYCLLANTFVLARVLLPHDNLPVVDLGYELHKATFNVSGFVSLVR